MNKQITVTLSGDAFTALDQIAPRGQRSRVIRDAVREHLKRALKQRLKASYLANAEEDVRLAVEWFPLEEEAWGAHCSDCADATTSR